MTKKPQHSAHPYFYGRTVFVQPLPLHCRHDFTYVTEHHSSPIPFASTVNPMRSVHCCHCWTDFSSGAASVLLAPTRTFARHLSSSAAEPCKPSPAQTRTFPLYIGQMTRTDPFERIRVNSTKIYASSATGDWLLAISTKVYAFIGYWRLAIGHSDPDVLPKTTE